MRKSKLITLKVVLRGLSSVVLIYILLLLLTRMDWPFSEGEKASRLSIRVHTRSLHTTRPPTQYFHLTDYLPPETDLEDRYIIYRCNSSQLCGGLADRQKGIVTSYLISQMLRRKFGIMMTRGGCDFTQYVIPNDVNWMVDGREVNGRSWDVKRLIDDNKMGYTIRDSNMKDIFDKNVSYYEGNIDYVRFLMNTSSISTVKWARHKSHYEIYRIAFAQLFKFAPGTVQRYKEFRDVTKGSPLICAHLRMGKSKTIPGDNALLSRHPDPEAVIDFLKHNLTISHPQKLFIATDSEDVRDLVKTSFPDRFVNLGGEIVHIDRFQRRYNCLGMEKAILDQFILATCDTLVMSNSGFSRIAAILRGEDKDLYLAGPHTVKSSKRLNPSHPHP